MSRRVYATVRALVVGWAVAACATVARGAALPQEAADKHLGVSACSSPLCHNAVTPWKNSGARLNEYRVWRERDHHARAFASLKTALGKRIGRTLGLQAVRAPACLACHADDAPPDRRGRQFDVRDGVGCEACHGGAERWLESHRSGVPREANLARGMYPTEDPRARAELCLSCHLGGERKLVTHRMLAAGHPRLSFEVDTFTQLQPPHWVADARYVARKGRPPSNVTAWAVGQAVALRQYLGLLGARTSGARWAEFVVFDCSSCHRDVSAQPGMGARSGTSLGLPELTDGPFVLYQRVLTMIDRPAADGIERNLRGLNRSIAERRPDAASRAAALREQVAASLDVIAHATLDGPHTLAALAGCDRRSSAISYPVAEQLTMGIQAALASMHGEETLKDDPDVQRLLAATRSLGTFDASRFRSALRGMCGREF